MSELILQVGKPYRTRSGEKVKIEGYLKLVETSYPFIGIDEDGNKEFYTEDGRYNVHRMNSPYDLISEWEEEPKIHFEQPVPHFPNGGIRTNESILQEAERIINGDRREAYGDVKESFENVAAGWAIIFKDGVTPHRVGLAMAWLKICRENNNHKRDNLVDLAGYAALIEKL